jgi:hypothetical protein
MAESHVIDVPTQQEAYIKQMYNTKFEEEAIPICFNEEMFF